MCKLKFIGYKNNKIKGFEMRIEVRVYETVIKVVF